MIKFFQSSKKSKYNDVEFVQGLLVDRNIQNALYTHWKKYFENNYKGVFFDVEDKKDEIIHNTFIILWNKVESGRIYVEDGVLKGNNGMPLSSSLTTYMMGVAKLYYKEIVRENAKIVYFDDIKSNKRNDSEADDRSVQDILHGADESINPFDEVHGDNLMYDIISDALVTMSERCTQILTMFYYKGMNLDMILESVDSYTSKDALKTKKNKCMDQLKSVCRERYMIAINS